MCAQTKETEFKPLSVGDSLPASLIDEISLISGLDVVSYNSNGLIILAFIDFRCRSSLSFLSTIDSVVKANSDSVRTIVFAVNREEDNMAIRQGTAWKSLQFPIFTSGRLMRQLFAFKYVPHLVWIRQQKVVATTSADYFGTENISVALKRDHLDWYHKRDILDYPYSLPILSVQDEIASRVNSPKNRYYSYFSSHLENVPRRIGLNVDSIRGESRMFFVNCSIMQLFATALQIPYSFPQNRIVVEIENRNSIFSEGLMELEWIRRYTYCYEATVPIYLTREQMYKKLYSDLKFYLGIDARLEKRKTKCLVLGRISNELGSKGAPSSNSKTFETLKYNISRINHLPPLIDLSGLDNSKGILFELETTSLSNLDDLNRQLEPQGLRLTEDIREVELLVLSRNE